MHLHSQDMIVFAIVALAAWYLVRRLMRSAQGHSDGACSKCACDDKKTA